MLYGEHLSADEVAVKCACGVTATVEVVDGLSRSCGWFCRTCGHKKRVELRRREKIARAILRKEMP